MCSNQNIYHVVGNRPQAQYKGYKIGQFICLDLLLPLLNVCRNTPAVLIHF